MEVVVVVAVGLYRWNVAGNSKRANAETPPINYSYQIQPRLRSVIDSLKGIYSPKTNKQKIIQNYHEILGIILINFKYTLDVILKSWYQNKVHVHILEFLWEMFKSKQKLYFERET